MRLGVDGLRALGGTFICEAGFKGFNVQGYFGILRAHLTAKAGWIDLEGVNGASQAPAAFTWRLILDIGYWILDDRGVPLADQSADPVGVI